jgi:hypothetical protein
MQVTKSKLESEIASCRQALQDTERKYHVLENKANEEGDALRREIRAQGLSIAALQEAAMAKATSHAASSEVSEEVKSPLASFWRKTQTCEQRTMLWIQYVTCTQIASFRL